MNIIYKSSVRNAEAWRLVANGETFIPIQGAVEFEKTVQDLLKVVYIISALDGTEISVEYTCTDKDENLFEDSKKKSPFPKVVPKSNETQVTLNIPIN